MTLTFLCPVSLELSRVSFTEEFQSWVASDSESGGQGALNCGVNLKANIKDFIFCTTTNGQFKTVLVKRNEKRQYWLREIKNS